MTLESSQRELQNCFRLHRNLRFEKEVMDAQSLESPNRDNFGTPPWESREKVSFGCSLRGELQRILREGGGFPRVQAMVSQVNPRSPVACPTPNECKMNSNQLVGWFWMQDRITK